MATKKQLALWNEIKGALGSYFSDRGFSATEKSMRFYRETPDGVVQVVSFSLVGGGTALEVFLMFFVKEQLTSGYRAHDLEGSLAVYVGDTLGDDGVGDEFYDDYVETPKQTAKLLKKIPKKMDKYGIPYLSSIMTRQQFWDACDPDDRKEFEQNGMKGLILKGVKGA